MELMVSATCIDILDLWIGKSCATWNILSRMVNNYLTFNTKVFPLMGVIFIRTGSPTFFYWYTGCQSYRHCILIEAEKNFQNRFYSVQGKSSRYDMKCQFHNVNKLHVKVPIHLTYM